MSKVTITLTDIPAALGRPARLDLHVEYEPALDIAIPSHEHALLMIGTLDQIAEPQGEPVHILKPTDKAPLIRRNADGQVVGWGHGG